MGDNDIEPTDLVATQMTLILSNWSGLSIHHACNASTDNIQEHIIGGTLSKYV